MGGCFDERRGGMGDTGGSGGGNGGSKGGGGRRRGPAVLTGQRVPGASCKIDPGRVRNCERPGRMVVVGADVEMESAGRMTGLVEDGFVIVAETGTDVGVSAESDIVVPTGLTCATSFLELGDIWGKIGSGVETSCVGFDGSNVETSIRFDTVDKGVENVADLLC